MFKDGKKVAQLPKTELDKLTDKWQASMVMYVVEESPIIAFVKRFMNIVWTFVS